MGCCSLQDARFIAYKPNRSPAQRVRFGKEKQHHRSIGRRLRRLMTDGIVLTWRSGWDSTCAAAQAASGFKAPPALCQEPSGSNPADIKWKNRHRKGACFPIWRSGWDSNPRACEGQRFSRLSYETDFRGKWAKIALSIGSEKGLIKQAS